MHLRRHGGRTRPVHARTITTGRRSRTAQPRRRRQQPLSPLRGHKKRVEPRRLFAVTENRWLLPRLDRPAPGAAQDLRSFAPRRAFPGQQPRTGVQVDERAGDGTRDDDRAQRRGGTHTGHPTNYLTPRQRYPLDGTTSTHVPNRRLCRREFPEKPFFNCEPLDSEDLRVTRERTRERGDSGCSI